MGGSARVEVIARRETVVAVVTEFVNVKAVVLGAEAGDGSVYKHLKSAFRSA